MGFHGAHDIHRMDGSSAKHIAHRYPLSGTKTGVPVVYDKISVGVLGGHLKTTRSSAVEEEEREHKKTRLRDSASNQL